ncbi:pyridoxamine 5'-phosphate oxidase family protein [Psychromonas arctica]|uniref:pyridoxamine 5'-phosphate oxidase family protein n=1 Tax=Psychromonas arctica TaxID=168275 RepID=UPI002FD44814
MNNTLENSWHHGELTAQKRVGTEQRMAEIGPKFIRELMPQQHRDFFESLTMMFIGYTNFQSQTCASVLFGDRGFVSSPDPSVLVINLQYSIGDFTNQSVNIGDRVGLLGLEFDSRRRNRINVIVTDINQKTMTVKVLQSFGNCPKYIQPKTWGLNPNYNGSSLIAEVQLDSKISTDITIKQMIANADTFFIASCFDDGEQLNNRGTDISHRGGEAGFVEINESGQLLVEDYYGNGFFNTIGNLLLNPIASLLFFDAQLGHAIQLTVSAEILWNDDQVVESENKQQDTNTDKQVRTLCFTPIKIEYYANGFAYLQK